MIASMIASVSGSVMREPRAASGLGLHFERATQLLDRRSHDGHADAASADAIRFFARREARLADDVEQQPRIQRAVLDVHALGTSARAIAARSIPAPSSRDLDHHRLADG